MRIVFAAAPHRSRWNLAIIGAANILVSYAYFKDDAEREYLNKCLNGELKDDTGPLKILPGR
jgi:hypothetical protein